METSSLPSPHHDIEFSSEERDLAQALLLLFDIATDTSPKMTAPFHKFTSQKFEREYADMFFGGLESQFEYHKVDEEFARYSILVSTLDYKLLDEKSGNMVRKRPAITPYTLLKEAILDSIKPTDYSHVRALLKKEQLGDSMPSDLYARLLRIADPNGTGNAVILSDIKELWIHALPSAWHHTLLAISDMKEAAVKADVLANWEHNPGEAVASREVTTNTIPVAAVSSPFSPNAPQVSAASDSTDIGGRLARVEKTLAELSVFLMGDGSGNSHTNSSRGNRGRGGRNNNNNRSASPARVNSGLCLAHERYGQEAFSCRSYCTQYNAFMAKKGSNQEASNFQGRPQ